MRSKELHSIGGIVRNRANGIVFSGGRVVEC